MTTHNKAGTPIIAAMLIALVMASTAVTGQSASVKPVSAPPKARTVDAADHAFGLTAPDPYRWMEGRDNAEFQTWIKSEAAYTRTKLDALPTLAQWRERLAKASGDVVSNNHLQRAGGRIFFVRSTGKGSGTLMVRDADGSERVLLDPAKISAGDGASKGSARISRFAPSPDGSKVALNIDRGGDEVTRIEVIDVASGKTLPDFVGAIWGEFGAARLRAASASGNPVWVRGDSDEGHGIGSSFDARAQTYADIFAFLDAELPRHDAVSKTPVSTTNGVQ